MNDVEAEERKQREEGSRSGETRAGGTRRNAPEDNLFHEAWEWRGGMLCRKCEGKWSAGQLREGAPPRPMCRGSVARRAGAQDTGNVN